jgi:diphthine-ammonia ligase
LGKTIDKKTFEELKHIQQSKKINIAGEGGEYETLVVDGPIFQKKIVLKETEKQWKRDHGILFINETELEKKD